MASNLCLAKQIKLGTWTTPSVRGRPIKCSAIAQLVERSTVNRMVAGSSPARGANRISSEIP